jgi:hypothetical protein
MLLLLFPTLFPHSYLPPCLPFANGDNLTHPPDSLLPPTLRVSRSGQVWLALVAQVSATTVRPVSTSRNLAGFQPVKVGRDPPQPPPSTSSNALQTCTLNASKTRLRACTSTSSNASANAPSNVPSIPCCIRCTETYLRA